MTRSSRTLQCGVIVAFLLGLRVPAAQAQEFRGSITGTVSDKSAAVLPGVTVTATNVDTGIATTAVTNADGGYLLPFLTPGQYSVTAELMGFKKLVREGVEPCASAIASRWTSRWKSARSRRWYR